MLNQPDVSLLPFIVHGLAADMKGCIFNPVWEQLRVSQMSGPCSPDSPLVTVSRFFMYCSLSPG